MSLQGGAFDYTRMRGVFGKLLQVVKLFEQMFLVAARNFDFRFIGEDNRAAVAFDILFDVGCVHEVRLMNAEKVKLGKKLFEFL